MSRTKKSDSAEPLTARDLTPHARNANKGTERGSIQIEESIKAYGYGRGPVVDKNNVIIAGNHVIGVAAEKNAKIRVIETTGDELVIVKRTDLDLADPDDKRAVELAIADNRTSQVGLEWDSDVLRQELEEGAKLGQFFRDDELEKMRKKEEASSKDLEKESKIADGFNVKLTYTAVTYGEFLGLVNALGQDSGETDPARVVLEALRREASRVRL